MRNGASNPLIPNPEVYWPFSTNAPFRTILLVLIPNEEVAPLFRTPSRTMKGIVRAKTATDPCRQHPEVRQRKKGYRRFEWILDTHPHAGPTSRLRPISRKRPGGRRRSGRRSTTSQSSLGRGFLQLGRGLPDEIGSQWGTKAFFRRMARRSRWGSIPASVNVLARAFTLASIHLS